MEQYKGTPEAYLKVPKGQDIDVDALSCVLHRTNAIILLLQNNFEEEAGQISNLEAVYALWSVEGLLDQARVLISGK